MQKNKKTSLLLAALAAIGLFYQVAGGQENPICPKPTIRYVVASPRACLVGLAENTIDSPCKQTPAAENFPRKYNNELKVPIGIRIIFCLSHSTESVWYPNSYGKIGTSIILQQRNNNLPEDPNDTDSWVTIGKDSASDIRQGPSIGRAKVGVPVLFNEPGIYALRAVVHTSAQGYCLNDTTPSNITNEASDHDIIYIKVSIVALPFDRVIPDTEPTLDPDAEHIIPMPKEINPDDPVLLSGDLNGDLSVDMADLAIMAQQWGKETALPRSGD